MIADRSLANAIEAPRTRADLRVEGVVRRLGIDVGPIIGIAGEIGRHLQCSRPGPREADAAARKSGWIKCRWSR